MSDQNVTINVLLKGGGAVKQGIKDIAEGATKAFGAMTALGTALAGAAGLGSLASAAISTARLGGQLSDLTKRTGASTEFLIKFRQALADTGAGADSAGHVLNKMQEAIYNASTQGGAASDALQSIGLQASNLAQLRPDEQFTAIQNAIGGIADPAQRTATAMAIFGRSAGELIPLLTEGGAMDNAASKLSKMPEVLARNIPILDDISDAFDRLPNKATQLFAGIFDQLGPTVKAILDAFESIDLTGTGQRIGAFVNVAIDAFKAGKFGELIGDLIEAGFDMGIESGANIFRRFTSWLGSGSMWASIGNGLLTAINESMKVAAGLIIDLIVPLGAIADYAGDALGYAFQGAANGLAKALEWVINESVKWTNEKFGTSFQTVSFAREKGFQAPDFARSMDMNKQGADAAKEYVKGFFDESTSAFRQLTGSSDFAAGSGAKERLAARIDAKLAEANAKESHGQPIAPAAIVAGMNVKLELQKLELRYAQELAQIRESTGQVEANWLLTNNQKYEAKKVLLQQQLDLIHGQVAALEALKASANESERLQIDQKIAGLNGQAGGVGNQMMGMGADPNSFSDQFNQTLVNLQNNFQTVAQAMASTFSSAFNAATSSISGGIDGLIMGTKNLGQALLGISQGVVQSLVKSFSDMVAQWIMSHIVMKGVSMAWAAFQSAMRTKDVIQANATEAAKMPALAVNATLASIGSWGVAAIIGVAAIAGILAGMGAFREGGYTGDGDPNAPAGIVHRGEFVVPADAVDRIGVSSLEAMVSGGASTPVATSSAAPSPIALNLGYFDDPRRMADWARSQDGRTVLVDIVRQHAHEFSRA